MPRNQPWTVSSIENQRSLQSLKAARSVAHAANMPAGLHRGAWGHGMQPSLLWHAEGPSQPQCPGTPSAHLKIRLMARRNLLVAQGTWRRFLCKVHMELALI